MDKTINFKRGSVELMVLHLLNQRDCYGYEMTQIMKHVTDGVINIPVGSLYPSLYKLIENAYITDYKQQVGARQVRVYYHIEKTGQEHLKHLLEEYAETHEAIHKILDYKLSPEVTYDTVAKGKSRSKLHART